MTQRRSTCSLSRKALLVGTAMASGVLAPQFAAAQIVRPPVRPAVDQNGVDVIRGSFNLSVPGVSIGPDDERGLGYVRTLINRSWTDREEGTIVVSGSTYIVTAKGASDSFTYNGTTFAATEGNGATLVKSGVTYTYQSSSGITASYRDIAGLNYKQSTSTKADVLPVSSSRWN